ncbi:uncharacterized protein LOC113275525 [Papaver somniferum]|uniref:uncharacterized protein LOC113275525 n=1 Tax=Papaver somniferum TaxID=3469 RepID=UPI000E6FA4D7|nr:uncharacterized protein LOC113275525 [Papaver somniferum]
MVKKKTIEIQLRSSTPKKLAKASAEPNVTPRLISKATNNLNSSSRNVVLDFGDDPKPTQPTQASGGDNLHVGGSQGIVDLQNDVEQARFWTKASKKVINLEEAFKAMQESVCNLDNWGEDECHPEDAPWTQPLLYSESEDAKEWSEFCNNFKEVGPGGPSVRGDRYEFGDQEGSSEDDGYEQLLETDDEAEGNVNELRSCSKCKQTGHNKTTCGGGAVGLNLKAKRLRTEVDGQTFTSINYNHGQSRTGKRKNNGNNNINLAESSQPGGSLVD